MGVQNGVRNTVQNIRVLIADDHAIVREGLRTLINTEPGMELVGEAANGAEAVEKARKLNPDVILMDLVMPVMNGLDAIVEIRRENPQARILVLTSFVEDDKVLPAVKAGALGYLLKDTLPDELIEAIRNVYKGEPSLDAAVALKLMREIREPVKSPSLEEALTHRELDVLKLVGLGLSNQEVANRLFISEWTVRTHVSEILTKLHLSNRTQAALYAVKKGLVELE
jgi:two-component system, NarL family, response regulator LiaR